PPETLGQMERLGRASEVRFVTEIRRLDDERIAVPSTSGVAKPLSKPGGEVWPSIDWNDTNLVNHLVQDDHFVRRLENLQIGVVRPGQRGQRTLDDASLPQSSIEPRIGAPTTGRHVANRRSKRLELLAFLGLRRQRRNFSVRRINDQRRAPRSD